MNLLISITLLLFFISCGAVDNIFYDAKLVGDNGVILRPGANAELELDTIFPLDNESYGSYLLVEGRCAGTSSVLVSSSFITDGKMSIDCVNSEFSKRIQLNMPTNTDTNVSLEIQAKQENKLIKNTRNIIVNAQKPEKVSLLEVASKQINSLEVVWTKSETTQRAIENYILEYKVQGITDWTVVDKARSTSTRYVIKDLNPKSEYEIRVTADNGNLADPSDIAADSTLPEHDFYNPDKTSLINVGGALNSTIVSMEDNNQIMLNQNIIATLNAGQTHSFVSAKNDIISASGKVHIAGGLIKQNSANKQGQIAWANKDSTGKSFIISVSRFQGHRLNMFAFEDTQITIKKGSTIVETVNLLKNQSHSTNLATNGQYSITATGYISSFIYSEGSAAQYVVDPYLMQACSKNLIGFPSRYGQIVSDVAAVSTVVHSDDFEQVLTVNPGNRTQFNTRGAGSLYKGYPVTVKSDQKVCVRSNADSTGYGSASFIPVSRMRNTYAIETDAKWVAFASLEAGTIDLVDPTGLTIQTLTLSKTGSKVDAPYYARVENAAAGTIFKASTRVGAWYETKGQDGSSKDDETILNGYDL